MTLLPPRDEKTHRRDMALMGTTRIADVTRDRIAALTR